MNAASDQRHPGPSCKNRRLYPPRSHRRYYIQTLLTRHITSLAQAHLGDARDLVLVDYGCGTMPYRPILEPYLDRYVGADLPDNDQAQIHILPDGRLDLPDASADVVLSMQVLEHVDQPARYLAECCRVLRPGGRLFLSTHGFWWYHPHPSDFWRWTGQGLRKILTEAGLQINELRGLMGLAATGVHLTQDGTYRLIPQWIRPTFFFLMQNLAWLLDKLTDDEQRQANASVYVTVSTRL